MASQTFKGRPAVPGTAEGSAEVSHVGFNTCATYVDVLISGVASGVCQDHDNEDTNCAVLHKTRERLLNRRKKLRRHEPNGHSRHRRILGIVGTRSFDGER